jgi:hypothetical protein
MSQPIKCLAVLLLVLFPITPSLLAHEGHKHETIDAVKAAVRGKEVVVMMVEKGKLEARWKLIEPQKTAIKKVKDRDEWEVIFENPAAKDKAKASLYVYLATDGDYKAANFTGVP